MIILFYTYITIDVSKFTKITFPVNDIINNIYFLQNYGIDLGKGTFSNRVRQQNHLMNRSMILSISISTFLLMIIGLCKKGIQMYQIKDNWVLIKKEKNYLQIEIGAILKKRKLIYITEIKFILQLFQIVMGDQQRLKGLN
ncbi:unnamed protein product [Paramecium primaurelia]|uniref:Transmembrane protein n=1 Tax=Paramecium primaurelia TaxID=5886 RepID=A0A8S1M3K5_PARPR|nr:unnamed protein product [Paramecium primaurelia]